MEKGPSNLFRLQPQFVPPLVEFRASDYLTSIARRLLEILSSRSAILSGLRRQKNQTLADFTAADIPSFWLLYTINSALPVFRRAVQQSFARHLTDSDVVALQRVLPKLTPGDAEPS